MQADGPSADYRIFGLNVRSGVLLPELAPRPFSAEPDVSIAQGTIAADHSLGDGMHSVDGAAVLVVGGVGRYLIEGGARIVVEPAAGADERNVRLFLLGSAFGVLIHQRGLLPLHANAIEIDGRAIAFTGAPGAGKSTLAAWFHDRDYSILADDVCVVRLDSKHRPVAVPGLPRLRLWREALEASGRVVGSYQRSFLGDDDWDKYDVPLDSERVAAGEAQLAAVYLLERGPELRIEPLNGLDAAQVLIENTYRGEYIPAVGDAERHWRTCVELAKRVPVFRVEREWQLSTFDRQVREVLLHVEAQLRSLAEHPRR